jgi:hypothetical protein
MFDVHCSMLNVHCSMLNVHCSMLNVHCSLFDSVVLWYKNTKTAIYQRRSCTPSQPNTATSSSRMKKNCISISSTSGTAWPR